MKKYFCFLAMLIVILTFSLSCFAVDNVNENVNAILNREVSIVYNNELKSFYDVNGTEVKPLTYNGTTYLPVRAISALFDIKVFWDAENNKVVLGNVKGDVIASTCQTITNFVSGENENVELILNKNLVIEYKEQPQTFTDVNGTIVYPLSYNGTTYLPVRAISNMYGATVDWNEATKRITLARENKISKITNVTINVINDVICAVITTDSPLYNYSYAKDEVSSQKKVWIDMQDTEFAINKSNLPINYGSLQQVRFGTHANNINRVVLDLSEFDTYTVLQSDDRCTTYFALSSTFQIPEGNIEPKDYVLVASIGNQVFIPESDKINPPVNNSGENNDAVLTPPISGESDNNVNSGDKENSEENNKPNEDVLTEEQIKKMAKVKKITYSSSTDKTKISITGNYEFEKFYWSDENKLVIDLENALLMVDGPTEITPKNKCVKKIRIAQYKQNIVRVVFELDKAVDYEIKETTSGVEVLIEEPEYRNVEYTLMDGYAELRLLDVNKKVFKVSETVSTNKVTITYTSSKFDSGKKTLSIKDKFVKTLDIRTNKITITGSKKISYEMIQDDDDVVIKITERVSKPSDKNGKFVVLLDAGHGGSDPGACHGTGDERYLPENQEKTYTLEIMLKIKELLEEEDDIEVIVSRKKDVYIDRQGRIDFVLDNPDADLLVSVHINSYTKEAANGFEVMYCDKPNEKEDYGITSKELAMILIDNFKKEVDINIRGLSGRPGSTQWILEQNSTGAISSATKEDRPVTNLPAVICELCFISNESDFAKLVTEDFQDDAAFALYQGILEAKEQMER